MEIFSKIYSWFQTYPESLHQFLSGLDCEMVEGSNTNQFVLIGIVTLLVSALFCMLFYVVRHSKFNGLLSWFVVLLLDAVTSWLVGWGICRANEGDIPECFLYKPGTLDLQINEMAFIDFGFTNAIVAILWFLLFSVILKRFSTDCRHTPWKSIWPKH